jgi:DNA-binding CsgD family transcriptional regulator
MTRRSSRRPAERATDREVGVVAAILVAGSEQAAAHRLGPSHSTVKRHLANARTKVGATTTAQLVWILAPRLPEPGDMAMGTSSDPTVAPGTYRESANQPEIDVAGELPRARGRLGSPHRSSRAAH